MIPLFEQCRAGVLLHPTSLPGSGANGTLGEGAWRFVDWLAAGGFGVWQTLPLGPVDRYGSPYCLRSAHAGEPKLLDAEHLRSLRALPRAMRFDGVGAARKELYESFVAVASPEQKHDFATFVRGARRWLLPYGLFELMSTRFGGAAWWTWPRKFRDRDLRALFEQLAHHRDVFRAVLFEQYLFELQWSALKRYANDRGVLLFGDLPFYVDRNSVEVWWHRELFELTSDGEPRAVAGVPPDYFNADGQLWGNPLYAWQTMQRRGFRWWIERLRDQLRRFDLVRIDHFRALESYWRVPAGAKTAREGEWRHSPGDALLAAVIRELGRVPIVAEDLGIITDDVRALRDRFELPGMVVLQFGFDGAENNPHLPHNHRANSVVYTGTHDNDTVVGWYAGLDEHARDTVRRFLGEPPAGGVAEWLIDAAYGSRAALAMVPLQDLLGLGSAARMNEPGTVEGNWRWRFSWSQVPDDLAARCRARAVAAGRSPRERMADFPVFGSSGA
jgi:4-alpha-glucanotransferase